jgi:acyl-CoA thioesterase YciA
MTEQYNASPDIGAGDTHGTAPEATPAPASTNGRFTPPHAGADETEGFPPHRASSQPTLRVMARPSDANIYGDVFGGWIMSHVDIAASLVAARRANGRVVTVAVNSFVFKQPVFVGDLLSFYAEVVRTGRTSMTIDVEVFAQRMHAPNNVVRVTEATLTFVATGDDRRPRALPPL